MSRTENSNGQQQPLALAKALSQRTQTLCNGLEHGSADILELVTPTTAELLRWWFGDEACGARAIISS